MSSHTTIIVIFMKIEHFLVPIILLSLTVWKKWLHPPCTLDWGFEALHWRNLYYSYDPSPNDVCRHISKPEVIWCRRSCDPHPLPTQWAGTNCQKWPKIQFLIRWQENGVVTAWSSFLSADIIPTAPSDNSVVNKSGGGIKGSPMSRHKWWKMAKFNF